MDVLRSVWSPRAQHVTDKGLFEKVVDPVARCLQSETTRDGQPYKHGITATCVRLETCCALLVRGVHATSGPSRGRRARRIVRAQDFRVDAPRDSRRAEWDP